MIKHTPTHGKRKTETEGRIFLWLLSHRISFQVHNLEEKHSSLFFFLLNQNQWEKSNKITTIVYMIFLQ